ncbi:hypothetical protein LVJ94_34860 [Pendulispora rubella]|uniref:Uncharacterized protein n=1 Tax=Pendulispora rubella TaxID=2741070 RepID=A0ABZ2L0G7_9BACT
MSDPLGLLQGVESAPARRHIGAEDLEVLGKQAARSFQRGDQASLADAVIEIVKDAALSPEHVRRVCEHANIDAFLTQFHKSGAESRVVDFANGPADPDAIVRQLNAAKVASTVDAAAAELSDYVLPPPDRLSGEALWEGTLKAAFGTDGGSIPFERPLGDAIELRDKLASADEHVLAQIGGLEGMYRDLGEQLYAHVKQAALSGVPLGHIAEAWASVSREGIDPAFQLVAPRLVRDGVFSPDDLLNSADKTASNRVVNREHPLVATFAEFSDALQKLAHLRGARAEIGHAFETISAFVKKAAVMGSAYRAAARGSEAVADAVSPFVGKAFGGGAEFATRKVLENAHNVGLALGANEAYTHLKHSPSPAARAVRSAGNVVLRNIPGTTQQMQHAWEIENGI